MKDQRLDDFSRRLARGLDERAANRRSLLRWTLGGTAATAAARGIVLPVAIRRNQVNAQAPSTRRAVWQPDLSEIAFSLEYDIDRIFQFVATEIRYEPYVGVLRGPTGTLWGMSGNSMDQALLLQSLLGEAHVPTRIVTGSLNAEAVAKLLDAIEIDADAVSADQAKRMAAPKSQRPSDLVNVVGTPVTDAEVTDFTQRAEALRPVLMDAVRSQLAATVGLLDASLNEAGIQLGQTTSTVPKLEQSRHVWLQVAQGTDWVDLDPSIPGAERGKMYAADPVTIDEIRADDHHTVTIRVVADVIRAGQLAEEELLTFTGRSDDLVGVPVSFFHAKPKMLAGAITAAIAGQEEYRPYLQVGEAVTEGGPMLFNGQGGALDVFGEPSTREGEPVTERMVIEISSPGEEPIVETRVIFNRIDAAEMATRDIAELIAELEPIETVQLDPDAGPTFLRLVGAANISIVSAPVPAQYFVQDYSLSDVAGDLAYQNHAYHFLRDMLGAELAAETGQRYFRNRPALTLLDYGIKFDDSGQQVALYSLDLVQPSLATLPLKGAKPANAAIVEGVLNQVAERNLIEIGSRIAPDTLQLTFTNIGILFEEAKEQGITTRTLLPGTPIPAQVTDALSATARERISQSLERGHVVVLPERPVLLNGTELSGWWEIDPVSGRTLDRLESGRGSGMAEEATLLDIVIEVAHEAYVLGSCIAGIAAAAGCIVALALGGGSGYAAGAVAGAVHGAGFCLAAASGAGWF